MKAATLTKISLISICVAIGLVQVPMAQAQSSSKTSQTDPDYANDRPSQTSQGSSSSSTNTSQTSQGSSSYTVNTSSTSSNFKFSLDMSSVINGIFSPPHRQTEINANAGIEKEKLRLNGEIEKAKIAAEANKNVDRVAPTLTKWGVSRVNCAPGTVFINGLSAGTVCINPTVSIPAGYYSYNPDRQLLVRVETHNPPTPVPASTAAKKTNSVTPGTGQNRGF
jgi:hypothetical protein